MPSETWVDYKQLKERVSLEQVLEHYGLLAELVRRGNTVTGKCPVHDGDNPRQFTANLVDNWWKCFSGNCTYRNDKGKVGGNQIDLVAGIEDCGFRDAALLLQEWFSITPQRPAPSTRRKGMRISRKREEKGSESPPAPDKVPTANKPLSFHLQNLDVEHPYLHRRGLTRDTIEYFGLGFCSKGSMKNRIAIPIHNAGGQLVGYAGRWALGDEELPEGEGKYKLPPGFHKSLEVYNLHRIPEGTKRVILVEGYASVWWLHQNGFPNVVSCMGSTLSEEQQRLLAKRFKGVEIFFDGDASGEFGARDALLALASRMWVKLARCPEGLQPDRLPEHELKHLLS